MIKKSGAKKSVTKAAVKKNPPVKTAEKVEAKPTQAIKGDQTSITENKNEKVKNLPNLDAFAQSFDDKKLDNADKTGSSDKADKVDEAAKADKTEKSDKGEKPEAEEKKFPPEVQQKIDTLEAQLKDAEKRGDKDAIDKLKKQLEELKNPAANGGQETPGTSPAEGGTPAVDGAANGGGTPAGGGSPAGGGNQAGGGAPADGASQAGGGSPSGGSAPAGDSSGGSPVSGTNEANAGQQASEQEVNQFIQFAAQAYGVNPTLLSEIARRESNFNTGDIPNNWDSNAKKGTPSKGMFQFIQPTFESMMPKAKQANPQAWQGVGESWTDWKAQALTCAWAISDGKGSHWSTYNSALQTAGGNPRA